MKFVLTECGLRLYYRDMKPREGKEYILELQFQNNVPNVTTYNNIQQVHFTSGDLWCPIVASKYEQFAIFNGKYIKVIVKG